MRVVVAWGMGAAFSVADESCGPSDFLFELIIWMIDLDMSCGAGAALLFRRSCDSAPPSFLLGCLDKVHCAENCFGIRLGSRLNTSACVSHFGFRNRVVRGKNSDKNL